ncbi:TonB family protein [Compostibacter hankyongensis]|uniref:M56 family metallopeptidase n=1 Tax=Compostibacter hankyongensis TaxID=1007089 RepID=A0ABP8FH91_9BACT
MSYFIYLAQFNLYLLLFFFLYQLLFRKDTFFVFHRWFLLGGIACSALLPFLRLAGPVFPDSPAAAPVRMIASFTTATLPLAAHPVPAAQPAFNPFSLLVLFYLAGVLVSGALLLYKVCRTFRMIHSHPRERGEICIHVFTGKGSAVFSFWRYLFAPADVSPLVSAHEAVHIRQRHSLDNLLLELVKTACWFNPVVYLYQRALRLVHEYTADETVTRAYSKQAYAHLLAAQSFDLPVALLHTFSSPSQLKNRLIMLQKTKSGKTARRKYALSLPLFALLLGISASAFALRDNMQHSLEALKGGRTAGILISGKVADDEGNALAGVTVMILGDTRGTVTAKNGTFTLPDVSENSLLRFTRVGYAGQTLAVKGHTHLTVMLNRQAVDVSNVVVVGYAAPDTAQSQEAAPAKHPANGVFTFVEQMPQFPGGKGEMMKYLRDHIRYPQAARKAHISGNVLVSFIVGADGSISNIGTHNAPLGGGLEEEAIRVVQEMPHWKPGRQNGTAVSVEYHMPIRFVLQ